MCEYVEITVILLISNAPSEILQAWGHGFVSKHRRWRQLTKYCMIIEMFFISDYSDLCVELEGWRSGRGGVHGVHNVRGVGGDRRHLDAAAAGRVTVAEEQDRRRRHPLVVVW